MTFEPELGQAIFSNSPWGAHETPGYITRGIDVLADYVSLGDYSRNPAANSGCDPFANDTFEMRPYCWCDGERPGHEEGCPPNFRCGDFEARWYKHSQRSPSQNRTLSRHEWAVIFQRCFASLVGDAV